MFTVLIYGGIGDALQNLSIFPHREIYRATGIRTRALYKPTTEHQYANPPGTDFFRGMVERFDSLRWGGETATHRGPGAYANRLVRECIKLRNGGKPWYFPLEPKLSQQELAELPDLANQHVIALQTHLLGTKTKAWGLERWQQFIKLLAGRHPGSRIVVLEPSPEAEQLVVAPGVITTNRLNLYQMLYLFRYFALTISIDSWAKYAAAWNRSAQIVIATDQRPVHPSITADRMLSLQFAGIFGVPLNRTLGLEVDSAGHGQYTLPLIEQLTPDDLLRETEDHLRKFPTRLSP